MKIAVTSRGVSPGDQVDPRFGRCPYFLIIDTETMDVEPVENPNVSLGGGAGIQSAQLMAERDVRVILTGNCGPNAFQTLNAAEIEVIVGVSGKVKNVVEQFKSGSLSSIQAPNVISHFGMGIGSTPVSADGPQSSGFGMGRGRGGGRGMGRGAGRGMGRGGGRGMGRGGGRGMDMMQDIPAMDSQFRQNSVGRERQAGDATEQELDALKAQAEAVERQLQDIHERSSQIRRDSVSSHLVAIVDARKCNTCGTCQEVCPVGAITIDAIAIVNRADCTGCGRCVEECPRAAITLQKA
jgi:predicted Fe-Mo cluster-binding NifX family protein/ferredoxin